jgi:hypothetical protein
VVSGVVLEAWVMRVPKLDVKRDEVYDIMSDEIFCEHDTYTGILRAG